MLSGLQIAVNDSTQNPHLRWASQARLATLYWFPERLASTAFPISSRSWRER